jgi:LysR family transcriptional regulator, glycine cleavage system transcriptional activator
MVNWRFAQYSRQYLDSRSAQGVKKAMSFDDDGEFDSPVHRQRLPSLHALKCFEAAAREESFRRAADALNLTHGAVSRAVRLIEDDLGVMLFDRRNRRVYLTREGRRLAEAVSGGFSLIEAACRELRMHGGRATLTLACEPTLLMRWLIPQFPVFQKANPDLDVHLVAASGTVLGNGIDMAIRRNDISWGEEIAAVHLFDEQVGPVCRHDLVQEFFSPADGLWRLRRSATLLHTSTRPDAWKTWGSLVGQKLGSHKARTFEHFYYSLQAAVAGLGVAIGPWKLVQADIESGLLAAPAGFLEDGSAYYLLSSPLGVDDRTRAIVVEWLTTIAHP